MSDLISNVALWQLILFGAIAFTIAYYASVRYRPGLRNAPGPFVASISDSDRIWSCAKGLQMQYLIALDRKYGPFVRIGPNHIMFSDASLIPRDEEQLIDDSLMISHSAGNIFAGSDTTAASLRSIFYHLCKNETAHDKLLAGIDAADRMGKLSKPVTFAEAQDLPYFQAVLREALRMHPAVGLLLERLVPKGGAEIGGVFLPEGTIVGASPWVMARDKSVYGEDADVFRPERWLEADGQQLKLMERNDLSFGGGARTCLGKNISVLE
ncbi:hypothetical protein AC579_665, partial [Pseudocercospora musae]